jgi:hypothetical protein
VNAATFEDWLSEHPDFAGDEPATERIDRTDGPIPKGRRNAHLASLAGAMRRRAMSPEAIAAALVEENTRHCDPPLAESEARAIAASVGRYAPATGQGLPADDLIDAADVAAEGLAIEAAGVQYVVKDIIPDYGVLGMNVAYAKVGKTTFGHALGASVATGTDFLGRTVQQARVLTIASEDPPEYTAWLARHLTVPAGAMTFYRRPIRFDAEGLEAITTTVLDGGYGMVLVSSWQAVVAGLVRDENDNAGAVAIVERAKMAARTTRIPWLIDAHSGKGEDQSDDADPIRALRGASAAAGAADFMLSLRYADGPFSSRRRLSGKGRFVSLEPVLLDYDISTGIFTALTDGKSVAAESTWLQITESGVMHDWCSTDAISMAIGLVGKSGRVTTTGRRRVREALRNRPGVDMKSETRRGQTTTLYRFSEGAQ